MAYQYDRTILSNINAKKGSKRSDLKEKALKAGAPNSSFHAALKRLDKKSFIEVTPDLLNPKEAHITITKLGRKYRSTLPSS